MAEFAGRLADLVGLPGQPELLQASVESAFVGRYGGPNRLQREVVSAMRGGASCLVVSPPASGKTEAAVIPLVEKAMSTGRAIVYLCPTRALINDIVARLEPGFAALGLEVVARHGEARRSPSAYRRATCIVATPEALQSAVTHAEPFVARIGSVIIDELHALDGTARGAQLAVVLADVARVAQVGLRRVALSATVADPARMATRWGVNEEPLLVVRGAQPPERARLEVLDGGVDGLRRWLARPDAPSKVLVFTNSRRRCEELFLVLKGSSRHVPLIHYSDLERADRIATEELLRSLPQVACIATSTLELGIDVGDIDAVVLADAPWSSRTLRQRVGRAGRRSDDAIATCFPLTDRDLVRAVAAAETPVEADDDALQPVYPSVLVQQAVVAILANPKHRLLARDLEGQGLVLGIPTDLVDRVLAHLRDQGVLTPGGRGWFELSVAGEKLLGRDVWGNFPAGHGGWELRVAGRAIATVALELRPFAGIGLQFAGRRWRVVGVYRRTLALAPDDTIADAIIPVYHEPAPPTTVGLADAMRRIVSGVEPATVVLSERARLRLGALRDELGELVGGGPVLVGGPRGPRVLTFAGSRANALLASLVPQAAGSDEVGIDLASPLSAAAWARIGRTIDLDGVAERVAPALAERIPANRWSEYLPQRLQRLEVASQIASPIVLARLREILDSPLATGPRPEIAL